MFQSLLVTHFVSQNAVFQPLQQNKWEYAYFNSVILLSNYEKKEK